MYPNHIFVILRAMSPKVATSVGASISEFDSSAPNMTKKTTVSTNVIRIASFKSVVTPDMNSYHAQWRGQAAHYADCRHIEVLD